MRVNIYTTGLVASVLVLGFVLSAAVIASEAESEPKQSVDAASDSAKKEEAPFRLHAVSKNQKNLRGSALKGLTRTLMYPISARTHENKRVETPRAEARTLNASAAKSLADFELELIVDESSSMLRRDCPGDLSRWEWCGEQLSDLSRQLSPYVQQGFTLVTFSSDYEVLKNATPEDLVERFNKHLLDVGTRLSLPLNSRLKHYFETKNSSSKPLLIVVITDGMPHPRTEPALVIDSIIDASKRVKNERELTIAVFQIGHDNPDGKSFVKEIDEQLVSRGANHDIVKSLPFEELERVGLVNALVSMVRNFAAASEAGHSLQDSAEQQH
ncbi:MAG: VWA domain-containing protein [Candidatus Obscuribacterales bacterium]|nr:VWA domain-containing protein [Candidatus Obscuribacterales bacterium]